MQRHGLFGPSQVAGRHWPVGCVALEITQRCNLDCRLCYLSDHAEAVRDLPLEEVFRRIDLIERHYGRDVNVQVTGGDPTLRARHELVAIVGRLAERGMRPALFTNGIRASRGLLRELAAAGLKDVAFHVDTTQGRKGYASEAALNALRRDYLERARGLGLHVLFNVTVTMANLARGAGAGPLLHRPRRRRAPRLLPAAGGYRARRLAPGRSRPDPGGGDRADRARCSALPSASIRRRSAIRPAIAMPAVWSRAAWSRRCSTIPTSPPRCSRAPQARRSTGLALALRHLDLLPRALAFGVRKLRQLGPGLWRARGRVHKLSFHVHAFMDADRLERARSKAVSSWP